MIDEAAAKEIITLTNEIRDEEGALKLKKARRRLLSEAFAENLQASGVRNITLCGKTLYLMRKINVSIKADKKQEAVELAPRFDLNGMLCLQPQAFAAWARERIKEDGTLPAQIGELVNVYDHDELGVRSVGDSN
jgi:hypothetical protein